MHILLDIIIVRICIYNREYNHANLRNPENKINLENQRMRYFAETALHHTQVKQIGKQIQEMNIKYREKERAHH